VHNARAIMKAPYKAPDTPYTVLGNGTFTTVTAVDDLDIDFQSLPAKSPCSYHRWSLNLFDN